MPVCRRDPVYDIRDLTLFETRLDPEMTRGFSVLGDVSAKILVSEGFDVLSFGHACVRVLVDGFIFRLRRIFNCAALCVFAPFVCLFGRREDNNEHISMSTAK